MTANRIEKRMLDRVKDEFDRREGSVIYDATAPASVEFAELYILADVILKQAFATTADREFLILRAAEFNIYPEPATQGEFEAQFNMEVPIGSRFNYNEYNFVVQNISINSNANSTDALLMRLQVISRQYKVLMALPLLRY